MCEFTTLQLMPCYEGEPMPAEPDLSAYKPDALRRVFRDALLNYAEPIDLHFDTSTLGRIIVQLEIVRHTAALASVLRPKPDQPGQARFLAAAILLSGFAEADDAAIDLALETPPFCNIPNLPPETWESARAGPRPLMVNVLGTPSDFSDPHVRLMCNTLAETFFDLLGQSE